MNSALWELLFSAVLVLEIPALISSVILGIGALRMRRRPKTRWIWIAMLVGLTVPWAGAAIGLFFGLLLSLAFSDFWVPLIAGISIGVLYLQFRWTTLILTEWKEPRYIPETSNNEKSTKENQKDSPPEQERPDQIDPDPSATAEKSIGLPSENPTESTHQVPSDTLSDENPDGSTSPT